MDTFPSNLFLHKITYEPKGVGRRIRCYGMQGLPLDDCFALATIAGSPHCDLSKKLFRTLRGESRKIAQVLRGKAEKNRTTRKKAKSILVWYRVEEEKLK